jgi:hypothetical protein
VSFQLRCVIATAASSTQARTLLAGLTTDIPHTRGRAFEAPFAGVLVGAYYDELLRAYDQDPTAFAGEDPDELEWLVPERLGAASCRFPGKRFAFVDVDCFGGVCMYSGEIIVDGERVGPAIQASADGHQRLLEQLGVLDPPRVFPPFERGFLAGAEPPARPHQAIVGALAGWIAGIELARLGPILHVGLDGDWTVQPIGDASLLLIGGADAIATSIHAGTTQHVFGGRSHLVHERVIPLLDVLAELLDDFDLRFEWTLSDAVSEAVIQRWSG